MKKCRGLIVGKFDDEEAEIINQAVRVRGCSDIHFINNDDPETLPCKKIHFIACTPKIYNKFEELFKQCGKNKFICVITGKYEEFSLIPYVAQCYIDKELGALNCVPHKQL